MNDLLSKTIVQLKNEFTNNNNGRSHIQEIIPTVSSEKLPINKSDLNMLHNFVKNNSIYSSTYELEVLDIPCTVYEGDMSNYWIDSIKHDTSYAPFYPIWILSAYVLALYAKNLGVNEVIDIGSGDGRIAYCAKIVGIMSHGIEIDENLVSLQKTISSGTSVYYNAIAGDATQFDYSELNLSRPAFFISGLPEVGEMLSNSVISKIQSIPTVKKNSLIVLAGSHATRKYVTNNSKWGWGILIDNFNLKLINTVTLPTYWTIDQPIDTPYIFTKFN